MKNVGDIIKFIEENLPSATYDRPFKEDFFSTVFRREGKWFGIYLKASDSFFKNNGIAPTSTKEVLNLKCPPDLQIFLKEKYPRGILAAYHMNKIHWISLIMGANVPDDEIKQLITLSYDITK